jgi:hypothetical protein
MLGIAGAALFVWVWIALERENRQLRANIQKQDLVLQLRQTQWRALTRVIVYGVPDKVLSERDPGWTPLYTDVLVAMTRLHGYDRQVYGDWRQKQVADDDSTQIAVLRK